MHSISEDFIYYKSTLKPDLEKEKSCNSERRKQLEGKKFSGIDKNKTWKEWLNKNGFGIDNLLFSVKGTYMNSCRQNDVYEIEDFLATVQKQIAVSFDSCIDPSPYIDIYSEALTMMKYIRDYSEDDLDNDEQIIERTGKASFEYWDDDLYTSDSKVCRTESWAEVTRSFCRVEDNVKNFADDTPTWSQIVSSIDGGNNGKELEKIREKREKRARAEAISYVNANIPIPFLRIKPAQSDKTNSDDHSIISRLLKVIMAPIINARDNLNSPAHSSKSSLEVFSVNENLTNSSIKILEVQKMLISLTDNYSKSFAEQVSLEHTINSITESVKTTTKKRGGKETFYDFVSTLKSTEKVYSCSVPDPTLK